MDRDTVPAGYMLVPVEPSAAMLEACGIADANTWGSVGGMYRAMWSAMLAAAPSTPATEPAGDTPRSAPAEVELLPCPFCGSGARYRPNSTEWWVECTKSGVCPANMVEHLGCAHRENAVRIWNARASSKSVEQSEVSRPREGVWGNAELDAGAPNSFDPNKRGFRP